MIESCGKGHPETSHLRNTSQRVSFSVLVLADNILFVASFDPSTGNGEIREYTASGATINASLMSGLPYPFGIAVSGSDLFVANSNTIGEYDKGAAAARFLNAINRLNHQPPQPQLRDNVMSRPQCVWYGRRQAGACDIGLKLPGVSR
jgi:hypothetical protein